MSLPVEKVSPPSGTDLPTPNGGDFNSSISPSASLEQNGCNGRNAGFAWAEQHGLLLTWLWPLLSL